MATHTLMSRRAALTGALAALPIASLPAPAFAAANPDPDARLVELGREWRERYDYLETKEAEALPQREWDVLSEQRNDIEKLILATPAVGISGLGVKAMIAKRYDSGWGNPADYALLEEVLRLSGEEG